MVLEATEIDAGGGEASTEREAARGSSGSPAEIDAEEEGEVRR